MGQPKGGYTRSAGKTSGTQVALPKRVVRHIAIMPSTSCGELKALLLAGLLSDNTTIQCYEDTSRINGQATLEGMQTAVVTLLRKWGWSSERIDDQVRFYDADITSSCVDDAAEWGKQLDWVYLDFCSWVDFDCLLVLHDKWKANRFTSDAEISVTCNHKLRGVTKSLKPILMGLSKYARRVDAYVRGNTSTNRDIPGLILGSQVGIAYALPFGATVTETLTYARGMTTTRFKRSKTITRPGGGLSTLFNTSAKLYRTRPKGYRNLSGARWAWHHDNPSGYRQGTPAAKKPAAKKPAAKPARTTGSIVTFDNLGQFA